MSLVVLIAAISLISLTAQSGPWWAYPAAIALFVLSTWSLWRSGAGQRTSVNDELWKPRKLSDDNAREVAKENRRLLFAMVGWTSLGGVSLVAAMLVMISAVG